MSFTVDPRMHIEIENLKLDGDEAFGAKIIVTPSLIKEKINPEIGNPRRFTSPMEDWMLIETCEKFRKICSEISEGREEGASSTQAIKQGFIKI